MKRVIATDYLSYLPRRVKQHIVSIEKSLSDDYNDRGQRLYEYTVTWDNDDVHTFENFDYMIEMIRTYTSDDGYYDSP